MSQSIQEKPVGNTKPTGLKYQMYRYCITLPHEELTEPAKLSLHLKNIGCKSFTFQLEKGEKSEFLHWQIELSLKHKEYFSEFKNLFGFNKAHIEPTKDYFAAKAYCSKETTRVMGPFNEKTDFLTYITVLRQWQKDLEAELLIPPEYFSRKIIWYYDNSGSMGKSEFCRRMGILHKASLVTGKQNGKDVAFYIGEDPKIILFDLERGDSCRFDYHMIQYLKNGQIFSPKYESGVKFFNKPHIVIFSNEMPDIDALTHDKWDIRIWNNGVISNFII